jgi:hypothetical protein
VFRHCPVSVVFCHLCEQQSSEFMTDARMATDGCLLSWLIFGSMRTGGAQDILLDGIVDWTASSNFICLISLSAGSCRTLGSDSQQLMPRARLMAHHYIACLRCWLTISDVRLASNWSLVFALTSALWFAFGERLCKWRVNLLNFSLLIKTFATIRVVLFCWKKFKWVLMSLACIISIERKGKFEPK